MHIMTRWKVLKAARIAGNNDLHFDAQKQEITVAKIAVKILAEYCIGHSPPHKGY
jgi:hypothetical protein